MDPVAAELLHADRYDEGNSRFWQFCERALTRVFTLEHYTYQFLRQDTKLHLPYFATIYSFSTVSTEGRREPALTTGDRRPEGPTMLHMFLLSR
jgi:hypothetical protein